MIGKIPVLAFYFRRDTAFLERTAAPRTWDGDSNSTSNAAGLHPVCATGNRPRSCSKDCEGNYSPFRH